MRETTLFWHTLFRPGFKVKLLPSCLALFLLSSLGLPAAAKLSSDFDPELDFSKYKTFAYIGGVENLVMIQLNPDLLNTRMHQMIVRELSAKGLREVNASQSPDLVVRYWVSPESSVNVAVMGNWAPYGPYTAGVWASQYSSATAANRRESTLILDLIDARAKSLAWRLYVTRKMSDPDKDWKRADEEFAEGFKAYPPSENAKAEKRKERRQAGKP